MKTLVIAHYQNHRDKLYIPISNEAYLEITSSGIINVRVGVPDGLVAQFPAVMNGTYTWYILPYKVSWLDRLLGV